MPGRTSLKKGQTQTSKEEGGSTTRTTAQIEKYYSGGKRPFSYKKNDRGKIVKIPQMLSGGQAKIAAKAPPPNKIDEKDFAVLRAEKAKGRGMGLQDESVKPGKVMKANLGLMFMKRAKDKGAKGLEFLSPLAMLKRISGKKMGGVAKYKRGSGLNLPVISSVKPGSKVGKGKTKFKSMEAMRKAKGFKPGESASEFNKRRMALEVGKKALKATTVGKIALGVGAAGVAAQQYLKSKMKKKDEPKKKMGGGMMQRPMGYKIGTGKKPLETAMNKKRAEQTKNVKRLTTESDAYDPERRILHASKKTRSGSTNTARITTDQVNLKEARDKFKSELPRGFNVRIKTPEEMRPRKSMGRYSKGVMVKARGCKLGRTKPTKIT